MSMWQMVRSLSLCLLLGATVALAQVEEGDLRLFGYFQNQFEYESDVENNKDDATTFGLPQLNVLMQKDLAPRWRSFVNFEVLNSFSSSRRWGAFNIEEAWARYRLSKEFSLKLGLQIPIFNHLNEIKNRTPLLPYSIRPLVYESSFNEILSLEEYLPARAFVQAYGFIPYQNAKIDYAVFLGNSPNVRTVQDEGQSGVDTTNTFLLGGRVGTRWRDLKVGVSATRDEVNSFQVVHNDLGELTTFSGEWSRLRLGGDLSYDDGRWRLDGEFIVVEYDEDIAKAKFDKRFYYGTAGYYATEQLFVYVSYWFNKEHFSVLSVAGDQLVVLSDSFDIKVANLGTAYNVNDRVVVKVQLARGDIESSSELVQVRKFDVYSSAISVFF